LIAAAVTIGLRKSDAVSPKERADGDENVVED